MWCMTILRPSDNTTAPVILASAIAVPNTVINFVSQTLALNNAISKTGSVGRMELFFGRFQTNGIECKRAFCRVGFR
jgi:L-cysteine desulfidase